MSKPGHAERVDIRADGGFRRVREDQVVRASRFQHRQVTREQLRAAGTGDDAIDKRVRSGPLHPVFKGVLSLGGPPQTDREVWMAATLTFGPDAKLAASAAGLYGEAPLPLDGLSVLTPTPRRSRDENHHDPSHDPRALEVHGPHPGHRPGADRPRLRDDGEERQAYRRIVRAAQIEDTTHARLLAFAAMHAGARGIRRMRRELADGPSPTRSAIEHEALEIFRRGGQPLANHRFAPDLEGALYFPKLGVVIEVDSVIHDGPTADDARRDERYRALGLIPYRLRARR